MLQLIKVRNIRKLESSRRKLVTSTLDMLNLRVIGHLIRSVGGIELIGEMEIGNTYLVMICRGDG